MRGVPSKRYRDHQKRLKAFEARWAEPKASSPKKLADQRAAERRERNIQEAHRG